MWVLTMQNKKMTCLLAMLFVMLATTSSFGQLTGARFFAPVQNDQFGGQRRMPQGMFASVELTYRRLAKSQDSLVGLPGERRYMDTSRDVQYQTSNLSTDMIEYDWDLGMNLEVGKICGHHGWVASGYVTRDLTGEARGRNASLNIDDALTVEGKSIVYQTPLSYFWDKVLRDDNTVGEAVGPNGTSLIGDQLASGIGHFWGWFPYAPFGGSTVDGVLAPLPISFDQYVIANKVEHWSADLMYMYRCHPSRLGTFELFGGVRYLEFDDSFAFIGMGAPWDGNIHEGTDVRETLDYLQINPWQASDTINNWYVPYTSLSGTATGPGSILGNSSWTQKAQNHVVAPQLAARFTRRNGRWSFVADAKLMFGVNSQNMRIDGGIGAYTWQTSVNGTAVPTPNSVNFNGLDMTPDMPAPLPWTPIGLNQSNSSFSHRKFNSEFSPGVEAKLGANFQATSALSLSGGFDMLWMDKIARGSSMNTYSMSNDGTLFGIDKDKSLQDILMYGFRLGVTINR